MEKKSQISNLQSQIKLKVCGLTKLNQIQELIYLNVDFLGFIFYEKSPRFVLNHLSFDEIKSINHKGKVGVFVNESIEKIIEIAERGGLNYIQLHGDEDKNFILSKSFFLIFPILYTPFWLYKTIKKFSLIVIQRKLFV